MGGFWPCDGVILIYYNRESSTASLSASILEYRTIHGRTYHAERHGADKYWGPNDDRQNEAMDMK